MGTITPTEPEAENVGHGTECLLDLLDVWLTTPI